MIEMEGMSEKKKPSRKTLDTLRELKGKIPRPSTIYTDIMVFPNPYKNDSTKERMYMRDRALAALLYVACLRVSEAIRLAKDQFEFKDEDGKPWGYVNITRIKLSKRKPGNLKHREARLPLTGNRACFTKLILDYLEILKPDERLFPWSLKERTFVIKKHPYRLRDGQVKDRQSVQLVGTKRAYQIIHRMLPAWTQHWLRAFGESYLYDLWDHDIVAVADQVKVDTRTVEKYLVHRSEQYKAV
jgi:integrase